MTISIILIDSDNEAKEFTETNAMFDLEQDFLRSQLVDVNQNIHGIS
jgi:hypothetical protein